MNTLTQFTTIDEYINTFPKDVVDIMQRLRKIIKEEAPEVEEIIRYKMPTFTLKGKYLIYYAGWKNHIALYPFTPEMLTSMEESSKYNTSGKGTIQFPLNQPLPVTLIRNIVNFRVKEVLKQNEKTAY